MGSAKRFFQGACVNIALPCCPAGAAVCKKELMRFVFPGRGSPCREAGRLNITPLSLTRRWPLSFPVIANLPYARRTHLNLNLSLKTQATRTHALRHNEQPSLSIVSRDYAPPLVTRRDNRMKLPPNMTLRTIRMIRHDAHNKIPSLPIITHDKALPLFSRVEAFSLILQMKPRALFLTHVRKSFFSFPPR